MVCKVPHDHYNDGNKEDDDGNAVHAMHEEKVYAFRRIRVALFQEEVLLYLIPDAHYDILVL